MRQINCNLGRIKESVLSMEDSRRDHCIFAQFSRAARAFAFVPILLSLASAAAAQESAETRPTSQPKAIATSVSTTSGPIAAAVRLAPTAQQATGKISADASNSAVKSNGDPGNPADNYKKSR